MQKISNPFEVLLTEILGVKSQLEEIKKYLNQPGPAPEEEAFLTSIEVAEVFGVSTVTIWQWTKKGLLRSYRIGNLKRYKKSEILASPKFIEHKVGR